MRQPFAGTGTHFHEFLLANARRAQSDQHSGFGLEHLNELTDTLAGS